MAAFDLVAELARAIERNGPAKLLIVGPTAAATRWVQRLLIDHGPVIGARLVDIESLVQILATERFGPAIAREELHDLARAALAADETFYEVLDERTVVDEAVRVFAELCLADVDPARLPEADARDGAWLRAYARFDARVRSHRAWFRGNAWSLLLTRGGLDESPFLRGRGSTLCFGFRLAPRWQRSVLEALGAEAIDRAFVPADDLSSTADPRFPTLVSCAGPQAEVAMVSRAVRRAAVQGRACAVVVPGSEVAGFVSRLGHRDVPVRAFVGSDAETSATARLFVSLAHVVTRDRVTRRDLDRVLFSALLRPWPAISAAIGLPEEPRRGDLEEAWRGQRRRIGARTRWAGHIASALPSARQRAELEGHALGWAPEAVSARVRRVEAAHAALESAVSRLVAIDSPSGLHALLVDQALVKGAAAVARGDPRANETVAAHVILDELVRAAELPLAEACERVRVALAHERVGHWHDEIGGTPILPYDALVEGLVLPERVFACGLDRHPAPPLPDLVLSPRLRHELGLETTRRRYERDCRRLADLVTGSAEVVLSLRHRDGVGTACPPGPFVARMLGARASMRVGVDSLAADLDGRPTAPIEAEVLTPTEVLADKVAAIVSHEHESVGPHTGALGIAIMPNRPYSASGLQDYARNPYLYFVERVLGVREPEEVSETLDSMEQGTLVHEALERAMRPLLASGPVDVAAELAKLHAATLRELVAAYSERTQHGMTAAVWQRELARWEHETNLWFAEFARRLWFTQPEEKKPWNFPERDDPSTPGDRVIAVEFSFAIELSLSGRTIAVQGKIDRIEFDRRLGRIAVVDYKTGRARPQRALHSDVRSGEHIQLPLYALACTELIRDGALPHVGADARVEAMRLEYFKRPLGRVRGPASTIGLSTSDRIARGESSDDIDVLSIARTFVVAFVDAIESGHFPLVARVPVWRASRDEEVLRIVPTADERPSGLPAPFDRPDRARGGRT